MADEPLRYDRMVESALRGVVRDALAEAAKRGLPGEHHFYITFRSKAPGVAIPSYLAAQFPDEMTIVLQHQYWDLGADDAGFWVTLSFQGKNERLQIPFAAVTAFADPSVNFGLKFVSEEAAAANAQSGAAEKKDESAPAANPEVANVVTLDAFRKK
ncbi:MAG TPA: ClpXP protease specificity-enhancing factor SspB [Alphaproteobacteria bacterium]|jgi:hypothetical protein